MPRKQADLNGIEGPGVAPKRIKEIDEAAEEYIKQRDRRMALTKKEVAAKEVLTDLLHHHEKEIGRDPSGVLRYEFDETLVELSPVGEQLKVKAAVDEGAPD